MTNTESRELRLFIDNDGELYRQQTLPMIKNLCRKMKAGTYDSAKALKLWGDLAESGAEKYAKEFGGVRHQMFSVTDRKAVAEELARHFEVEYAANQYEGI